MKPEIERSKMICCYCGEFKQGSSFVTMDFFPGETEIIITICDDCVRLFHGNIVKETNNKERSKNGN